MAQLGRGFVPHSRRFGAIAERPVIVLSVEAGPEQVAFVSPTLRITYAVSVVSSSSFPTTNVLDSFTGADENPLSAGGNWSGPMLVGRNQWQRLSNVAAATTGSTNQSYWTPSTFLETEVFATISAKGTSTQWFDLCARIQAPNTAGIDMYQLEITNSAGADTWDLYRIINGSGTLIATLTATEVAAGDSVGLVVSGTGATVRLDAYHKPAAGAWTLIGTYDDTHADRITSAGYIGIETSNGSAWKLDDFGGGAVTSKNYALIEADSFDRANGDIDGDLTSLGSHPWMSPMHSGDSYHRISSNTLVANDQATQYSGAILDYDVGQNVRVELTITTVGTTDAMIVLRNPYTVKNYAYGAGSTYYRVDISNAGTDFMRIIRFVNGSATTLVTAPEGNLPSNMTNGCQFAAEVYEETGGTRIRAWFKPAAGSWTLIASYLDTDASRPTGKRIGIETNGGVGVPSTFVLDNLNVYVFSSATTTFVAPTLRVSYSTFAAEPNFQTVLDDANRANEDPINPTNWTIGPGGASTQIVSNHFESANSPPSSGMAVWNTQQPADVFVAVDFAADCPSGDVLGVSARSNDPDEKKNCYEATAGAASGTINLGYRDGTGTWNLLATGSIPGGLPRAGDAIGLVCHGSSIEAWFRRGSTWMRMHQVTDTTVTSSGYVSMGFYSGANDLQWDNFRAGAFVPGVSMPDVGITVTAGDTNLTWDVATATVEAVAPTLRITYTTPAATSSVAGVNPVLNETGVVPTATGTVAMVAPALQYSYAVSPPEGLLLDETGNPIRTEDGELIYLDGVPGSQAYAVIPTVGFVVTLAVSAATASAAAVPPGLSATYGVPAATATVEGGVMDITRPVPAAEATVQLVLPTLSISYSVPAATSSVNGVATGLAVTLGVPAADASGEGVAPSTVFTLVVPTATISGDGIAPIITFTFGVLAATATVAMPDVGFSAIGGLNLTWDVATATVDAVAPTTRLTYVVPAATASVDVVEPTTRITFAVSAATASVAGIPPDLSYVYDIVETSISAAMPDVGLQILGITTLIWDVATATITAVAPTTRFTFGVPAAAVSSAGVIPTTSFRFVVSTATASIAMPDVGIAIVETLDLVWDEPNISAQGVAPTLRDTYVVPASTASVAAIAPAVSERLVVPAATANAQGVAPALSYRFVVSTATASVAGQTVLISTAGEFNVVAATINAQAVAPTLRYSFAVSPATASVAGGTVGLITDEVNLTWDTATATVEMLDVGITITPYVPPTPTPGAGGGQLLEFFFNDLDLRVEPATLFVQMIPPMLRTYREVKRKRRLPIPFIKPPVPVVLEITFEERLREIQPKDQPQVVFTARPLERFAFTVEPQHMLLFSVPPVERKLYNFESPLWGKYRRRTEKEEFHEMLILGALD